MADYCCECTYLNVDRDTKDGQFWCDRRNWRYADAVACDSFCRAYSRPDQIAQSAKEYSKKAHGKPGCYLTTTLCNILRMNDDNIYLETLRKFRKDYLQKCEEGQEILIQYDVIGPKISKMLMNEPGKISMAQILLNNYIVPTVESIEKKEYAKAIKTYTEMTTGLIEHYKIDPTINVTVDEIEPTLSGHGVLRKKLNNA